MVKGERPTVLVPRKPALGWRQPGRRLVGEGSPNNICGGGDSRLGQREELNFHAGCDDPIGSSGGSGPSEVFPAETRSLGLCTLGIHQFQKVGINRLSGRDTALSCQPPPHPAAGVRVT